jgi:hypothetical protein
VTRLEGKPFVLLGVNNDNDREAVRQVIAVKHLTWRSWWDGGGEIAERWHVKEWPTMYVLDTQGVVRYRVRGAAELDQAVGRLLREAEGH